MIMRGGKQYKKLSWIHTVADLSFSLIVIVLCEILSLGKHLCTNITSNINVCIWKTADFRVEFG